MRCSGVTKFSSKIEIGFYFIYLMHKLCNLTCINENENKNLGVGVGLGWEEDQEDRFQT